MSRIYFHSPEGTAFVSGSERAYMGLTISDCFEAALDIPHFCNKTDPFFQLLPQHSYLQDYLRRLSSDTWPQFRESLATWLGAVTESQHFVLGDFRLDLFGAQLNTTYLMGSDQLKLMTRLHGQCEIHCYIEGQNREWLAEIIARGLKSAVFRPNLGWESVIELLQNGANSPVVTSYSVCDEFPNPYIAKFEPRIDEDGDPDWDTWYEQPGQTQWDLSMAGLREKSRGLELKPQNWLDFYFDHGWDAFKLNQLLQISSDKWGAIATAFHEAKLPAPEAWQVALKSVVLSPTK